MLISGVKQVSSGKNKKRLAVCVDNWRSSGPVPIETSEGVSGKTAILGDKQTFAQGKDPENDQNTGM